MSNLTLKPVLTLTITLVLFLLVPKVSALQDSKSLVLQPGSCSRPQAQVLSHGVKTGDRFITGRNEIRELMFSDGSTVTLGPNSSLTVLQSSNNGAGNPLELRIETGVFRIVGAMINKQVPVRVETPVANLELIDASVFVEVKADSTTRTWLVAGRELKVSSGGTTESLLRPGYELLVNSKQQAPIGPSRQKVGAARVDMAALSSAKMMAILDCEENLASGSEDNDSTGEDQDLASLATEDQPGGILSLPPGRPGSTGGGSGSEGFGPGEQLEPPELASDLPSQTNSDARSLAQNRTNAEFINEQGDFSELVREVGQTTNRLFYAKMDPFTQILGEVNPKPVKDKKIVRIKDGSLREEDILDKNIFYVFTNEGENGIPSDTGLILDTDDLSPFDHLFDDGTTFSFDVPVFLPGIEIKDAGVISTDDIVTRIYLKDFERVTENVTESGQGSQFEPATHYKFLQAGFSLVEKKVPVHENDDRETVHVVERNPDNFLLLEVRPGKLNNDDEPELDENRSERFLFATGDVDAGRIDPSTGQENQAFQPTSWIDRFFISPGLEGYDERATGNWVAEGSRAFLRQETALELDLTDTGLFIVNPASEAASRVLHADFALDGTGAAQQSTISLTLGKLNYVLNSCASCGDNGSDSYEVEIEGRTLGSSLGDIKDDQRGTVTFSSPLGNTAAGGGNPDLKREGYAGYLVLENYDPDNGLNGGVERGLGDDSEANYAYLRLATATDSGDVATSKLNLNGWVAGLSQSENNGQIVIHQIDTEDSSDNFALQTVQDSNGDTLGVDAQINFFGHRQIKLGGNSGDSAYINEDEFAANTAQRAAGNAAIISGDLLKAGLPETMQNKIPDYKYLKWGFFLGDTQPIVGATQYTHLGSWVAGERSTWNDISGLSGSATYSGHAIGNVFNNGVQYTEVGTYQNQWNFDDRRGNATLDFDGAVYTSDTQAVGSRNSNLESKFSGTLAGGSNRTGNLRGNFTRGGVDPAAGMTGRFSINETSGKVYRASGTFGAER